MHAVARNGRAQYAGKRFIHGLGHPKPPDTRDPKVTHLERMEPRNNLSEQQNDRRGCAGHLTWWRGGDSNPRPLGYEPNELPLLHPASHIFYCTSSDLPHRSHFGGARSGLASRGATPQYSPALRWVTTGFGMGPGGATALWATSPPEAAPMRQVPGTTGGRAHLPGGNKAKAGWRLALRSKGTVLGHEHDSAPVGCPPSTCRLATGSSSRGLTLCDQMGILVLRRGSHLDAFSGSPVRT